jgi:PEP-CTERM motif
MIRYMLLFLLGILSFNANAQQINVSTNGNLTFDMGHATTAYNDFEITHTGSEAFTDIFQFSLPNPGTGAYDIEAGWVGPYSTGLGLYNSSGTEISGSETNPLNGSEAEGWLLPEQLGAGSYHFIMGGAAIAGGSSYSFAYSVSPVPEPSTYALMLMGMLGMGYLVMRQARKTTAQQAFA